MNIRVTQNAMSRQYKNNMSRTLGQMNKINNKILTQRKFLRASENPVGAAKAVSIRKNLANIDTYEDNLKTATGIFNSAESSVKLVSSSTTTVTDKLLLGVNGDKDQSNRDIYAAEIENVGKEMIKEMNSQYADRRIFGGTNDSSVAFAYDDKTGDVTFNGTSINCTTVTARTTDSQTGLGYVDAKGNPIAKKYFFGGENITSDIKSGKAVFADDSSQIDAAKTTYTDDAVKDGSGNWILWNADKTVSTDITAQVTSGKIKLVDSTTKEGDKYYIGGKEITEAQANGANAQKYEGTKPILIDVGIGIEFNADGSINPATAMDISLNGAELTGSGTDSEGYSKNIIQLTFDAAKALRDGDKTKAYNMIDKIKDANSSVLVGITNLGVREQSIEFNQTKLDEDKYNLSAAQIDAEGMSEVELAAAMTEYKSVEAAYNATLQMGSKVVPTSIFDFIR